MTRRSRNNCCVVNCNSTYSNTENNIKFYEFPARPWELERKQQWIRAVNRKETDGSPWITKKGSLICSKRFVGGEKSNHPHNPTYLPTIFPNVYKRKCKTEADKRYERAQKRKCLLDVNEVGNIECGPNIPVKLDKSVDVLRGLTNNDEQQTMSRVYNIHYWLQRTRI